MRMFAEIAMRLTIFRDAFGDIFICLESQPPDCGRSIGLLSFVGNLPSNPREFIPWRNRVTEVQTDEQVNSQISSLHHFVPKRPKNVEKS